MIQHHFSLTSTAKRNGSNNGANQQIDIKLDQMLYAIGAIFSNFL